jgi:uracil-DNA glycosylase family 4
MPSPFPSASKYKFHKLLNAAFAKLGISSDAAIRIGASEVTAWPVVGYEDLNTTWMCGHRVSTHDDINAPRGPCDGIDLVIVGPYPEPEDAQFTRHFVGKISGVVLDALEHYGVDLSRVYYTTVGRHALPATDKKYKAIWAEVGQPFCHAELSMMKPKAIFAMGSQAVKMLFGKGTSIESIRGNHKVWEGIPVVPTVNPAQFMSGYAGIEEWEHDLREVLKLSGLGDGIEIVRDDINTRDYRMAISPEEWEKTVDDILATNPSKLAFDCEWGNDVGRDEFSYTLSVQVSWGPRTAAYFAFRAPGVAPEFIITKEDYGNPAKYPKPGHNVIHDAAALARCRAALTRLLKDSPAQIGGHNVRVDVKQLLVYEGIDLTEKLTKAFDTMLVHHLLHQDDDQGLEVCVKKYAPEMGSYWEPLQVWLKENSRDVRLRFGYRDIPGHIIVPYAMCDADGDFRVWLGLEAEWSAPRYDRIRELYYRSVIPANEALLEMETGGLLLDVDRMHVLNSVFKERFDEIDKELCERTNWPGLNVRSSVHTQELLFSSTPYRGRKDLVKKNTLELEKLDRKKAKKLSQWAEENPEKSVDEYDDEEDEVEKGGPIPPTARLLTLTPVCNTDKYPMSWADIAESGIEKYHYPSTKAESLKIILKSGVIDPKHAVDDADREYREYATFVVQAVHDIKILDQYLKNFLKLPKPNEFIIDPVTKAFRVAPPEEKPGPGELRVHENGKAFLDCMSQVTNRVTGTILQTTDTGRCRMFKANLQVFPKKQEGEIKRIMGKRKVPKVKSCVVPENWAMKPEIKTDDNDWVITEADFKQAENWIMAIVGNDEAMLKILRGGRDIHSENCVKSFQPAMPPVWAWSGSDPEKGAKFSDVAEATTAVDPKTKTAYEFVRVVPALLDCLDANGKVIKKPGEPVSDYDVWNNVVKALYPGQRTAAKSVSFGIPYGRAAKALTREIGKAGVKVTVDETQAVIDVFNGTFTGVRKMLDDARESAISREYVESVFGRCRYFTGVSRLGRARQAAAQREAGNFPIQGAVGDLLFVALVNLVTLRRTLPGCPPFKIRLVIHDAIVLEHRRKDTKFMHDLVRFCMGEANPIPGTGGLHLDADIETFERWSENTILKS